MNENPSKFTPEEEDSESSDLSSEEISQILQAAIRQKNGGSVDPYISHKRLEAEFEELMKLINLACDPDEVYVITRMFGLQGKRKHTDEEIALALEIDVYMVDELVSRGLRKIRDYPRFGSL